MPENTPRRPSRLTAVSIAHFPPGLHADSGPGAVVGLRLQVTERKGGGLGRSWLYRFNGPQSGKRRWLGLGPWPLVSLSRARDLADAARRQVKEGIDPIEFRRAQRAARKIEEARRYSFKQCCEEYLGLHKDQWRNAKHRWQWERTLEALYPVLGSQPVSDVDKHLIEKALKPLWDAKKYETLTRTQQRIAAILDWSASKDRRPAENPAKLRFFPVPSKSKRRRHHPALPFEEVPAFAADLRNNKATSARALEFLLITAVRSGSVRKARWSEIDLQKKLWEIPGEHTKAGRPHRVPLSDRAIAILKALPRVVGNDHLFPGQKEGEGLTDVALLKVMKRLRPGYVPHGLRSTFKDWASEISHHANIVSEAALEHVVESSVEAAYRRGDLVLKRAALMQDWATYCLSPRTGTKVIPIKRATLR